ncbi:MAG: hypothetical protein FWG98_07895 [Candidatus Cloacimonetes bacterium]|nr:hypothetical protein [Candidatus Cloacimonadota bacterium]
MKIESISEKFKEQKETDGLPIQISSQRVDKEDKISEISESKQELNTIDILSELIVTVLYNDKNLE